MGKHEQVHPDLQASLASYQISIDTGFIPNEPTAARFTSSSLLPWTKISEDVPRLLAQQQLRQAVLDLPIFSLDDEADITEFRLAYVVLAQIANAYIWGGTGEEPLHLLPWNLAVPLREIAEALDVPPGLTLAADALWNWKRNEETGEFEVISTFTGTDDERHFKLTTMTVEKVGGPALRACLEAAKLAARKAPKELESKLTQVASGIDACCDALKRMRDGCRPEVFYHQIRPYLGGSQSFPDGIFFSSSGSDPSQGEHLHLTGTTAGQSSLFQALDILLGVEHRSSSDRGEFVLAMRKGMPGDHARFLEDLSLMPSIRAYVTSSDVRSLHNAYDASLLALKRFRDEHFKIVALYVIAQSSGKGSDERGTGGSSLASLLKGMRQQTGDAVLDRGN